ncbi:MAG: hypothetical protein LBR81_03820 [Prevotellaceae bacterium]|jgi:hypothetical protein|nr:hypothetical protein [Prevotellaceae bacterium]
MGINQSLTARMALIGQGINGAMANPDIMNRLKDFGYTEEKMTAGKTLFDQTQVEVIAHKKEYGEQYSAYEVVEKLWEPIQNAYKQTRDLCRIGLKNKVGALHSLRATGSRSRSIAGFIKDARILYTNLMEQAEYLQTMNGFGISKEKLTTDLEAIQQLETAYQNYLKERGEAQDSTVKRDRLLDSLYDWYSDFRAVTRIALADNPQLMEGLGVVVK